MFETSKLEKTKGNKSSRQIHITKHISLPFTYWKNDKVKRLKTKQIKTFNSFGKFIENMHKPNREKIKQISQMLLIYMGFTLVD